MKKTLLLVPVLMLAFTAACGEKSAPTSTVAPEVLAEEAPVTEKNVDAVAAALEAELDKELAE